ncbi:LuxR C-terminal-related transcriptional regulator [Streptomyces sp. NBC_00390]|uniref:ATP-binding protein n=1 Tax=Streptomyces sp. NBC_00390 TaxID=2975736 RepID=UPI002E1EED7D
MPRVSGSRACAVCGNELGRRSGTGRGGRPARYCSDACRQRAFRRRSVRHDDDPAGPLPPAAGLPRALDSFVGRHDELTRLRALLKSSRLVTLTGPGGVGKTRLALHTVAHLRGAASGRRARLVELDTLHDGDRLPQAVAAALGVGERRGRTGVDVLVHALGGGSVLLILDNCEHLAEPCAELAAQLLARCPRLRILATSREALRVPGEVVFRVAELSLAPAHGPDDPATVPHCDAVRLFAERAATAAPGFTLNTSNAHTVAEICRRLDGLPLAIELAARRAGTLPLGDILTGLDDQLSLLTDGSRTGPGRHRELAAAIDWSHRLLDPREQAFLRRLAVLVGGFDATGAAAVCTAGGADGELRPQQVLRVLCALEAKSLLVRLPGDAAGAARFRQLSSVRAYALDRLTESGELHDTWQRAVDWLTRLLAPTADQVFVDQAGGAPTEERENLAAAVAHAGRERDISYLRPALALARVRYQQEQLTASRALLTRILQDDTEGVLGGAALALATRAACRQADRTAALRFAEQAVAVERRGHSPAALANALDARAAAHLCRGDFAGAVADFAECLGLVVPLGRPRDTAWCRHHLAWALLHTGKAAEGDALMSLCLPLLRTWPDGGASSAALHTAGAIRLALGDLDTAEELFAEALRTVPGQSLHALYPLEGLALVAGEQGDARRSLRLLTAAAQARRRLDTEPEAAWQRQVEAAAVRAQAALPPPARDAAVAEGGRLRWRQLIGHALHLDDRPETADPAAGRGDMSPLTGRESVVAALVAEGLTNREIASRLGLAASTVSTHLDHVRDKLGMRSRTQIALWVAERARVAAGRRPPRVS